MGVHIFKKSKKMQLVRNRKKNSVILFQKFLVFPTCNFSQNAQHFVQAFL